MNKTLSVTTKPRRPLAELNLLDDFLFQQILLQEKEGPEFCRILLSTILGRPIRNVRIIPQKNILGIDTDRHGIRLDAYIEDVSEEDNSSGKKAMDARILHDVYDVEPNKKFEKASLPKRMRYYHSIIDTQLLATSTDYNQLQKVVIIFILPYDPFDKKRMVYTIRNQCVEDSSIPYDDGSTKIFLYTKGTEGNPSQELKDMLQYMENTTDENVTNENLNSIHQIVENTKNKKEVSVNYMKSWEYEQMIRNEGLQQGIEQGIEQGIKSLILTLQEMNISWEEISFKLMQHFSLTSDEANNYIEKYRNE